MYKLFSRTILKQLVGNSLLLLSVIVWSPLAAAQGKVDFKQDIIIDSEREWFDIQNKIAIFEDNAVITQGTLKITADHLEVAQQGENGVRTFTAEGSPATYQQELEDGGLIQAQAQIIRYDETAQLLTLLGEVKVTQANSEIQGNEIVYNFGTQQIRASRGDDKSDRVTTIFKPNKKNNDEPINR
ncbi:lipopolysaccharide transport periplasmic protein LptA [Pseudidiomarina sp. E22-M8]|uniref:lipopolysaccharide transport periplasmic protein LptA n=1 Tax=Pseudidiomarina sp. E22-M8 TaxID=3424768 RepID=UPI00403CAD2B